MAAGIRSIPEMITVFAPLLKAYKDRSNPGRGFDVVVCLEIYLPAVTVLNSAIRSTRLNVFS